jgi:hypothetical protein
VRAVRIRIIELQEPCLNGCDDKLKDLLDVVEKLIVKRLAGDEISDVEYEELLYAAEDLYRCIVGGAPEGGEEWS